MSLQKVPDLINSPFRVKLLLVLESPDTAEVISGYPLSGLTGKFVKTYIRNHAKTGSPLTLFQDAFGPELAASGYRKIGIMNCSLWPLQSGGYTKNLTSTQIKLLKHFEEIRSGDGGQSRRARQIEARLISLFRRRMKVVLCRNPCVVVVPCGKLARRFVDRCGLPVRTVGEDVPHPSFNHWSRQSTPRFDRYLSKL
jgi:hypothetical protein